MTEDKIIMKVLRYLFKYTLFIGNIKLFLKHSLVIKIEYIFYQTIQPYSYTWILATLPYSLAII